MKLTSIPKLSYRIFKAFTWPATLPEFGRYNLMYAANGSGKTTLSHFFRLIAQSKPALPADCEAVISLDKQEINGHQLERYSLPSIRVFNRDSISRSVFEDVSGELPPVYYVGDDSVEKQKQILELRVEATKLSETLIRLRGKVDSAESGLDSFCIESARAIKNLLTASGSTYNNYDKSNFRMTADKMQKGSVPRDPLDGRQKEALIKLKSSPAKLSITPLSQVAPDYGSIKRQASTLLETKVVTQLIESLASDSSLASWVNQGLHLHQGSEKCKFCDQPLPPGRLQELTAHFNDQFQTFQTRLDSFYEDVEVAKGLLSQDMPSRAEFYDDLASAYGEISESIRKSIEEGRQFLTDIQSMIEVKRKQPFDALIFESTLATISGLTPENAEEFLQLDNDALTSRFGGAALASCNSLINKHNTRASNHNSEVEKARSKLELHEVATLVDTYTSKKQYIKDVGDEFSEVQEKAKTKHKEISELEEGIRTHQRPAAELTKELAAYLGNSELTFEPKDTGYLVRRSGQPAMNLSEGERTAIAFLHFLKSLSDTSFNLANGIVVIDDPVSSLDSNSLYCAFGYMKEKTAAAEQLFILTHNSTLFRLAKNWFKHMQHQRKKDIAMRPARFYMIAVDHAPEGRAARIAELDPLLHEYESEYHYLFKCVVDTSKLNIGDGDLAFCYGVANIARRVLETFLSFKLPDMDEDLNAKIGNVAFDPVKKARILRFLHVNSHAGQIDELDHDISILSETPAVLSDLLDLISNVDKQHYDGMCKTIGMPIIQTQSAEAPFSN
jgi:wobble nucleotide-excising tRNase